MTRTTETRFLLKKGEGTVEQLIRLLQRWSCELTDARHLMRRLQASGTDFQQALARLEEAALHSSCKGTYSSWIA